MCCAASPRLISWAVRGRPPEYVSVKLNGKPVFEKLYQSVASGEETKRVLDANSRPDYREQLDKELKEVAASEMWEAGKVVRALRPERISKSKG